MPPKIREWRTPDGQRATASYFAHVQDDVIQWWLQHRRSDLPWRPPSHELPSRPPFFNPYAIWVSEVMSQQTLMGTVINYFTSWMAKFPTIEALSRASEDEVRAVWSGMGYYRRAMYLLKGAQYLVDLHRREKRTGPVTMPSTAAELLKVPGVGPYTAGAIASVCFGEAVIATDGNVVRVLSRLRGERGFDPKLSANIKQAATWGQTLMTGGGDGVADGKIATHPGGLNQGLMELGASVCRPNSEPLCDQCPLRTSCCAWALRSAATIAAIDGVIPLRGSRSTKRKETVVCVVHEFVKEPNQAERGRFVVVRRPADGLLGGMLEFPSRGVALDADEQDDDDDNALVAHEAEALGCGAKLSSSAATPCSLQSRRLAPLRSVGSVTHVFSHIEMTVKVFHVRWLDADACDGDDSDVLASCFAGASTSTEDTISTRVAAALDATPSLPAEGQRATRSPKKTKGKATSQKAGHDGKRPTPPESVESRIAVMSEGDVRKAAASRLLLKILEATGTKCERPPRAAKRQRSSSGQK